MIANGISIVIGSWGSYNACNEKALGSGWLDLSEYSDWDEIADELTKRGFDLEGIDEELFVQDIEGIEGANWDYVNPETLFELLKEAEVLENSYYFDVMQAFLEVRGFNEFESLVNSYGSRWSDDINIYRNFDWDDYGREMFEAANFKKGLHYVEIITVFKHFSFFQ